MTHHFPTRRTALAVGAGLAAGAVLPAKSQETIRIRFAHPLSSPVNSWALARRSTR